MCVWHVCATQDDIRRKLTSSLRPVELLIVDQSSQHAGHAGAIRPGHAGAGPETHFRVEVVSPEFEGKSLVQRHRMINQVCGGGFLSLKARALMGMPPWALHMGSLWAGVACDTLIRQVSKQCISKKHMISGPHYPVGAMLLVEFFIVVLVDFCVFHRGFGGFLCFPSWFWWSFVFFIVVCGGGSHCGFWLGAHLLQQPYSAWGACCSRGRGHLLQPRPMLLVVALAAGPRGPCYSQGLLSPPAFVQPPTLTRACHPVAPGGPLTSPDLLPHPHAR